LALVVGGAGAVLVTSAPVRPGLGAGEGSAGFDDKDGEQSADLVAGQRSGAGCGASPPALRQCGRCSPGGVGRWIRTRCCPARLGRRGRTRWPRSLRRPGQCMPASRAVGAAGAAQQDRVTARWPDTHPCLFPRHRASAAGTRPLTYYSYRRPAKPVAGRLRHPRRAWPTRPAHPAPPVKPLPGGLADGCPFRSRPSRRSTRTAPARSTIRLRYARPVGSGTLSD
jgi:hypothetical protein